MYLGYRQLLTNDNSRLYIASDHSQAYKGHYVNNK